MPVLDAFRTLAILSVMCLHWLPRVSLLDRLQDQVTNGVHLFFVLSGFLITRTLLTSRAAMAEGNITFPHALRQFFARRALRIFPVFYLALGLGAALNFAGVRAGFWWHASYLSNLYYFRRNGNFDGPAGLFWSLAVEEQFYLVWPLVILLLPRRAVLPAVLATLLAGMGLRSYAQFHDHWAGMLTPLCANFLAAGAAVAVAGHPATGSPLAHRTVTRGFLLAGAVLAATSLGIFAVRGHAYWFTAPVIRAVDQAMVAVVFASIVDHVARHRGVGGPVGTLLRFPPIVYLGRISYGLYAYHLFVTYGLNGLPARLAHRIGPRGMHVTTVLVHDFGVRLAVTVVIASVSWFLMERPLNSLKRLFPYTR